MINLYELLAPCRDRKRTISLIAFIYIIICISFFDTFSQLPIMSPYAHGLGASSLLIGAIIGMYSFSNMIGNVFAGHFIDKLGRKRIMLVGMGTITLFLLLYAFVQSPTQLLVVRFLHGIGGGILVPAAFAYLADLSAESRKGRSMALSGACIGIAAIIAPAFGGIVSAYLSIQWVFFIVSGMFLIATICVALFLKESYQTTRKVTFSFRRLSKLFLNKRLQTAYLSAFALMFAMGILAFSLPLKVETMGYSPAWTGILMSLYGLVAIVFFIVPINRLSDKIGRFIPMFIGKVLIALSLCALSFSTELYMMVISMSVYGVGFALLFPAMNALIVDETDVHERGTAFGLFYAFFSLGVVFGPLLTGVLAFSPSAGLFFGFVTLLGLIASTVYIYKRSQIE